MTLVVDASVAVRWYLPEKGAEQAAEILSRPERLIAPELILAEIGSAVWKRVMKDEVGLGLAMQIVTHAPQQFSALKPLDLLAADAMRFAAELRHPIYGCFYLALAQREAATLVTVDKLLGSLAGKAGLMVEVLAIRD
jgi:predicted nucleic acid-binding protein